MRVPDAQRSNAFYQALFGFPIRSYQGPTVPTLAIGKVGFLVYSSRRGGVSATIDHVCLNLERFNVDRLKTTKSVPWDIAGFDGFDLFRIALFRDKPPEFRILSR